MIPKDKVQEIISRHDTLEKELSSGNIDKKHFASKSKEYSNLGNIILFAREYMKFEDEKRNLDIIINDKKSDNDLLEMAKNDLLELETKKIENKLIFLLPKDDDDDKNAIVEIRAEWGLEATILCRFIQNVKSLL